MKKDWTYKRFDEVFDLQMGKTPSRDNPSYWGGDNVWVSIADIQNKYICSSKECITDEAVLESGIKEVPKDTVIMSFKLSVGRSAITTKNLYTNEAIMAFNTKSGFKFMPAFIYYYLQGYKWEGANKAVMGMTLNKKSISSNIFAFPAYEEQQMIVAELDLLCGVIEKQKAQIEELDKLSQSIFYDMFGDPRTNDKGWTLIDIESICKNIVDCPHSTPRKVEMKTNYPCIRTSELKEGEIFWDSMQYLDEDEYHIRIARLKPEAGDIVFGREGSIGNAVILPQGYFFSLGQRTMLLRVNEKIINRFLLSVILSEWIKKQIKSVNVSSTVPHVNIKDFKKFIVPLPPLSLQQEFAAKIEAIEAMKAKVRQSLIESETLFNSRMDYYFN